MMYFDKLIRRLSSGGHGQLLSPVMLLWDELYNPFENTSVLPLTYTDALKKQTHHSDTSSVLTHPKRPVLSKPTPQQKRFIKTYDRGKQRDVNIVGSNISKLTEPKTNELKPKHSVQPLIQLFPALHSGRQEQVVSPPFITPFQTQEKLTGLYRRNFQTKQLNPSPRLERAQDKPLQPGSSVVFVNANDPASQQIHNEPLRRSLSTRTENIETPIASVAPLSTIPLGKPSRKRRKHTQKDTSPKLMIGRMKVDVVPVKEPSNTASSNRLVPTATKAATGGENSTQVQNMSFGLGQM
jgi:hypothetical protein